MQRKKSPSLNSKRSKRVLSTRAENGAIEIALIRGDGGDCLIPELEVWDRYPNSHRSSTALHQLSIAVMETASKGTRAASMATMHARVPLSVTGVTRWDRQNGTSCTMAATATTAHVGRAGTNARVHSEGAFRAFSSMGRWKRDLS